MKRLLENDYGVALKQSKAAVVEFKSPTCAHCKVMEKVLEQLEEKITDVDFYQIDIVENEAAIDQYQVRSVPTFLFFKDGEVKEKLIGEVHELILEQAINKLRK